MKGLFLTWIPPANENNQAEADISGTPGWVDSSTHTEQLRQPTNLALLFYMSGIKKKRTKQNTIPLISGSVSLMRVHTHIYMCIFCKHGIFISNGSWVYKIHSHLLAHLIFLSNSTMANQV